ncbi:hypothetical protein TNIN_458021 [Trichonephila inaurata madagascariensis]|uniref:Uncharacterized protein n=1 Tax=Trichonephila inaurata madagascariensis TaxID=2747483 RepID=A0A8X6XJC8_9ARAC|nr:hypothetical protein TNIN_458021 [Trichonephila inaurata madagascariensis]
MLYTRRDIVGTDNLPEGEDICRRKKKYVEESCEKKIGDGCAEKKVKSGNKMHVKSTLVPKTSSAKKFYFCLLENHNKPPSHGLKEKKNCPRSTNSNSGGSSEEQQPSFYTQFFFISFLYYQQLNNG